MLRLVLRTPPPIVVDLYHKDRRIAFTLRQKWDSVIAPGDIVFYKGTRYYWPHLTPPEVFVGRGKYEVVEVFLDEYYCPVKQTWRREQWAIIRTVKKPKSQLRVELRQLKVVRKVNSKKSFSLSVHQWQKVDAELPSYQRANLKGF